MSHSINPVAQYFTVTRGAAQAKVRALKGLDLIMFPCKTPVFDSEEAARQFCDHFNASQAALGRPVSLLGLSAIAFAAA